MYCEVREIEMQLTNVEKDLLEATEQTRRVTVEVPEEQRGSGKSHALVDQRVTLPENQNPRENPGGRRVGRDARVTCNG